MAANETLQLVNERGWRRGLGNLLRAEMGGWWKTSAWWVQSLIWTGVINLGIASVLWGSTEDAPAALSLYVLFSCLFPTIAVIIVLQDAIIGEKGVRHSGMGFVQTRFIHCFCSGKANCKQLWCAGYDDAVARACRLPSVFTRGQQLAESAQLSGGDGGHLALSTVLFDPDLDVGCTQRKPRRCDRHSVGAGIWVAVVDRHDPGIAVCTALAAGCRRGR